MKTNTMMMQQNAMNIAPHQKPPTPPMGTKMGTLRTGDRSIYRSPPVVAPPQVPSHYAPNYPMGQLRRQVSNNEQKGYTTLPLQTGHPQQHASLNQVPLGAAGIPFKQRDIQPMSHQQIIYAENKSMRFYKLYMEWTLMHPIVFITENILCIFRFGYSDYHDWTSFSTIAAPSI